MSATDIFVPRQSVLSYAPMSGSVTLLLSSLLGGAIPNAYGTM